MTPLTIEISKRIGFLNDIQNSIYLINEGDLTGHLRAFSATVDSQRYMMWYTEYQLFLPYNIVKAIVK